MEDNQHFLISTASFRGILKLSTIHENKELFLIVSLKRLKTWDDSVLEQLRAIEYGKLDILSIVTLEDVTELKLPFSQIVNYDVYLDGLLVPADANTYVDTFVGQNSKVNLTKIQLQTLKAYVKSLRNNYFLLRTLLNANINVPVKEVIKETMIEETEPTKEPTKVEVLEESTPRVDALFNLCATHLVRSVTIGYMFNHFRYLSPKSCNRSVDDGVITITSPPLLYGSYNFFMTFVIANESLSKDNIEFYIEKIFALLKEDSDLTNNPLYLAALLLLLLIYSIRVLLNSKADGFDQYVRFVFNRPEYQEHFINSLMKNERFVGFSKGLEFKFSMPAPAGEALEEISERYRYLIPISQESFAEAVLNENSDNKPTDFSTTGGQTLDIKRYFTDKRSDDTGISGFIHYTPTGEGDKTISKAYKHFVQYTKDPSLVIALKEEDMPLSVVKLFEVLKGVLTPHKIPKDLVSTMSYYQILCESLPDVKAISHQTLLYIVYQIMIPYSYDMYGNEYFYDCFL